MMASFTRSSDANKRQARTDTFVNALERSKLVDYDILSLCGPQGKDGEYAHLRSLGLLEGRSYIGCDKDKAIIESNRKEFPHVRWENGKIEHIARRIERIEGRSLAVFYDSCAIRNVFWDNDAFCQVTKVPYFKHPANYMDTLSTHDSPLSRLMDRLLPKDIVVVNVSTGGRPAPRELQETYYDKGLKELFVPAILQRDPTWKLVPWMSGSYRNLAITSCGPSAKYYKYKSTPPKQGRPSWYTSFCLTKEETKMKNMNDNSKAAVKALIKAEIPDVTIRLAMEGMGLNPSSLGAYKAHVTMGHK